MARDITDDYQRAMDVIYEFVDNPVNLTVRTTDTATHNERIVMVATPTQTTSAFNWPNVIIDDFETKPPEDYTYTEVEIPKKNNKVRKIVIPSKDLKSYQKGELSRLYVEFHKRVKEYKLQEVFHGFVPYRNCVSAAQMHVGFNSTVVMDIQNFFDSVTREMLADVSTNSRFFHADGYCAQGFPTSPILANIAIIPMMAEIKRKLKAIFPQFALTIYADDIQISTNLSDKRMIKHYVIDQLTLIIEKYGFQINHNKTHIKLAKYGYRRILGINVGNDHIRATRKTMRKIRAARHKRNNSSLGGLTTWSRCLPPR